MNQKELDEYITLFLSVHQSFRIKYADEFNEQDKQNIRDFPVGMTLVSDENEKLELICYFCDKTSVFSLLDDIP